MAFQGETEYLLLYYHNLTQLFYVITVSKLKLKEEADSTH